MRKKKLRHRFFPLTFTKFLRTRFLQSTSGLLPQKSTTAQLDWANLVNCLNLWSRRWFFSLSFFCFVYFYFVSCSQFLFYVFLLYFVVAVVVVVVFTICSLIFWPHLVLYIFFNLVDLYLFFLFSFSFSFFIEYLPVLFAYFQICDLDYLNMAFYNSGNYNCLYDTEFTGYLCMHKVSQRLTLRSERIFGNWNPFKNDDKLFFILP